MYQVISPVNVTTLQVLFASFFALTFAWIAFSCASAILGFLVLLFGKAKLPPLADTADMGRTALLMPVYNEDPERVFAALSRMGAGAPARGRCPPLRHLRAERHPQGPHRRRRARCL